MMAEEQIALAAGHSHGHAHRHIYKCARPCLATVLQPARNAISWAQTPPPQVSSPSHLLLPGDGHALRLEHRRAAGAVVATLPLKPRPKGPVVGGELRTCPLSCSRSKRSRVSAALLSGENTMFVCLSGRLRLANSHSSGPRQGCKLTKQPALHSERRTDPRCPPPPQSLAFLV